MSWHCKDENNNKEQNTPIRVIRAGLYQKCREYEKAVSTGIPGAKIEFESMEIWYFTNRLWLHRKWIISPRKRFILEMCYQYLLGLGWENLTPDETYAIRFISVHL